MPLNILTNDSIEIKLTDIQVNYLTTLKDITEISNITEPIQILVSNDIMQHVLYFTNEKQTTLEEDYDRSDVKFTENDKQYFYDLEPDTVIEICKAANYLNYRLCLELTSSVIADYLKDRSLEDCKKIFGEKDENFLNKRERDEISREFNWLPEKDEDDD